MTDIAVTRNDDASRYEIHHDGTLAGFAEYDLRPEGDAPEQIRFIHTEVDPAFQGKGLAGRLAAAWRDLDPAARPEAPLPADYALHPFEGGVLIRAGQWPQLGDRNIGGVPLTYRVVARALRPWLFTAYENRPTRLIKVPRPLDAFAETLAWVTRFDTEG